MLISAGCSVKDTNAPITSPTTTTTPDPQGISGTEGTEIYEPGTDNHNKGEGKKVINVWCHSDEVLKLISKFQELHPDFGYEVEIYSEYSFSDMSYDGALHKALINSGQEVPDIFSVETEQAVAFTQGSYYQYAADFKELGIDRETLVKNAQFPQYMIDVGTNPDGKLVALGHSSTAGAFIYRRSIAKEVWGTDDPAIIRGIIGPGWDNFFKAAADLRAKGYGICSGIDEIWLPVERSSDFSWVADGRLIIDPKREAFLDYARKLIENDYTNNTKQWTDGWFDDMNDKGEKKIFGFMGTADVIDYCIAPCCGGEAAGEGTYGDWAVCDPPAGFFQWGTMFLANKDTEHKAAVGEIIKWLTLDLSENGCQYLWANKKIDENKGIAASAAVMKDLDGRRDLLGGQDIFEAYISAANYSRGVNCTKYDYRINYFWLSQVREYAEGRKSRNQALADFKQQVAEDLPEIIME